MWPISPLGKWFLGFEKGGQNQKKKQLIFNFTYLIPNRRTQLHPCIEQPTRTLYPKGRSRNIGHCSRNARRIGGTDSGNRSYREDVVERRNIGGIKVDTWWLLCCWRFSYRRKSRWPKDLHRDRSAERHSQTPVSGSSDREVFPGW